MYVTYYIIITMVEFMWLRKNKKNHFYQNLSVQLLNDNCELITGGSICFLILLIDT